MTELEWLRSSNSAKLVQFLDPIRYSRQLVLFYAAYCNRVRHLFVHKDTKQALANIESCIDCEPSSDYWSEIHAFATRGSQAVTSSLPYQEVLVEHTTLEVAADAVMAIATACHPGNDVERRSDYHYAAVRDLASSVSFSKLPPHTLSESVRGIAPDSTEYAEQCRILREIVGNPFRPVTFNPSWRTSDVTLLARGIYDDRAFDRMPILADALQDAGCDEDAILNHCRETSLTHVRGCWVVDLVLGKQ